MRPRKSLIIALTSIKSTLPLYSANCIYFSHLTSQILLNFGNALANSNGGFTTTSTKTQNHSRLLHHTRPKSLGISARKLIVTKPQIYEK